MDTAKWHRTIVALVGLLSMFVLAGSVTASPAPQTAGDYAAIDAYISAQMTARRIPGMALGIVEGDQIAHLQGFGAADSSGRAVTPQTPFYIGSVTKSFTALAVMQLSEAGQIDLDAPVQDYLPWFALADKDASAQITVRHLLNHTSGISTTDGNRGLYSQQGLEEYVRGLDTVRLTEPVGTTFQYSNANYNIAGLIVEQVSGQTYADYVTEHIFEPLDMRHAHASQATAQAVGLSDGHHCMFGQAFRWPRSVPPAHLPEGFLIASAEDMSHYAIAMLNGGRYGDTTILSPQGIAELQTPAIPVNGGEELYAMGWHTDTQDGTARVWHAGDSGQFSAIVVLMPDSTSGFILLANATGFVQLTQIFQLASGVGNLLDGQPAAPVSVPFRLRFIYWAILLTPLLMISGSLYSWRYRQNKGVVHILLVILLYSGAAVLWLVVLPPMIDAPFSSVIRIEINHPELAVSMIASAALGIGWSVVYTVMNLRARRAT